MFMPTVLCCLVYIPCLATEKNTGQQDTDVHFSVHFFSQSKRVTGVSLLPHFLIPSNRSYAESLRVRRLRRSYTVVSTRDVYHKKFFQLTVCPVRQEHLTDLLTEAGFQNVERYGDFQANYDFYDPDFIIQVAKK